MSQDRLPNAFGDAEPPEVLRSRVIATLTSTGALATKGMRARRAAQWIGLTAAALIAGFLLGRVERATASDVPRYLLLLYEDSAYRDDRPGSEIVAEYARWADSLRQAGALELGEKLADDSRAAPQAPTGFFIVRAIDPSIARAIAASSPHVRQGGSVVVHRIEDTGPR